MKLRPATIHSSPDERVEVALCRRHRRLLDVEYQSPEGFTTRMTRSRILRRQMAMFCAGCRVKEIGLTPLFVDAQDEVASRFQRHVTRLLNGRTLLAMVRVSQSEHAPELTPRNVPRAPDAWQHAQLSAVARHVGIVHEGNTADSFEGMSYPKINDSALAR